MLIETSSNGALSVLLHTIRSINPEGQFLFHLLLFALCPRLMILPNRDPFNKRFILLTAFEGFLRKVLLKRPRVILRLPVLHVRYTSIILVES